MMALLQNVIGIGTHAARPAAGSAGILYYETDTKRLLRDNGSTWVDVQFYAAYIHVQEQEAQNTNAGTFTTGSWQTRVLNTVIADTASLATLASNQLSLPAGTYRVRACAPAFACGRHQLRVQNITDSSTLVTGAAAFAANPGGGGNGETSATLAGRFTLSGTKTVALQHRCEATSSSIGLGVACNFGVEVYAMLELWLEG